LTPFMPTSYTWTLDSYMGSEEASVKAHLVTKEICRA